MSDDLDLLIHRYFERTISPEEEARLRDRIVSEAAAADRFVELGELESGLVESFEAEADAPPAVRAARRPSWRAVARPRPVWPFVAAALFMAALLLAYLAPKPAAPGISRKPAAREREPAPRPPEPAPLTPLPDPPREVRVPPPPPVAPAAPRPAPPREAPEAPKPVVPKEPPPTQAVKPAVATVEQVEGESGLTAGQGVAAGAVVESRGRVALKMEDGTRLELRGEATVEMVSAKSVLVRRGILAAAVVRQRAPVVFSTPHAEVTVLGTRLTLNVSADATRVEVEEGRVRCRRLPDGASVEVAAGRFAVAAKGVALASKASPVARSFQDGPGYAGTRDVSITSTAPGSNAGTAEQLLLQKNNDATSAALLRWDVTSIPPGSRVLSAELTFWLTGAASGPGYRMHEVRRPWEEPEATWRAAGSGRPWQVQGAQGEGDRAGRVLGTLAPAPTGFTTVALNDAGVALVQAWVAAPAGNFGILIGGAAPCAAWGLESRETAEPARRPKLTVTYLPPAR